MDMQDAPAGIWKTNADGTREIDSEQMDRLHYFVAELAKNGIYSNLNLHVSRTLSEGEGYPQLKSGPWWASSNKWVMYYDPDVQRELKKYCKTLLTRPNPYRDGKSLANDPSVCLVEMLNENYFSRKGTSLLKDLPDRFRLSFEQRGTIGWSVDTRRMNCFARLGNLKKKLRRTLVQVEDWKDGLGEWVTNANEVKLKPAFVDGPQFGIGAVRFAPTKVSEQRHFQQFARRGVSLKANQPYTLSFWIRADRARELSVEVSSTAGEKWQSLGLFDVFKATSKWKRISRTFFPEETLAREVYIAFSFGNDVTPIEMLTCNWCLALTANHCP